MIGRWSGLRTQGLYTRLLVYLEVSRYYVHIYRTLQKWLPVHTPFKKCIKQLISQSSIVRVVSVLSGCDSDRGFLEIAESVECGDGKGSENVVMTGICFSLGLGRFMHDGSAVYGCDFVLSDEESSSSCPLQGRCGEKGWF